MSLQANKLEGPSNATLRLQAAKRDYEEGGQHPCLILRMEDHEFLVIPVDLNRVQPGGNQDC